MIDPKDLQRFLAYASVTTSATRGNETGSLLTALNLAQGRLGRSQDHHRPEAVSRATRLTPPHCRVRYIVAALRYAAILSISARSQLVRNVQASRCVSK